MGNDWPIRFSDSLRTFQLRGAIFLDSLASDTRLFEPYLYSRKGTIKVEAPPSDINIQKSQSFSFSRRTYKIATFGHIFNA